METDAYAGLMELIRGRRSIRRFQDRPIPPELLDRVLEAARWAPSAGNRQLFRLIVVQDRALVADLARAVEHTAAAAAAAQRPDQRHQYREYLQNFAAFGGAPVLVAPIFRAGLDLLEAGASGGLGPTTGSIPRPLLDGISSVSAAVMCACLAAHAQGLGSCWMTGPLLAAPELEALLQVPRGWFLAALIPLGYPDESPAPPARRALDRLVISVPDRPGRGERVS